MPADTAGQSHAQPDPNALATTSVKEATPLTQQEGQVSPQKPRDAEGVSTRSLMDHLGIPTEIQEQIRPKDVKPPEAVTSQGTEGPITDASTTEAPATEEEQEQEEESTETADATPPTDGTVSPFKDPRVQKRIDKEVKRRSRAERRADDAEARAEEIRTQLEQLNGQQAEAATAAPVAGGLLGAVTTEPQLDKMVSEADSLLDLLEANPEWLSDGAVFGEGEKAQVRKPEEFRAWKRDSEKIMRNAEARRRQIREANVERAKFTAAVRQDAPEFFDEEGKWRQDTEQYQTAVAVANRFPELKGRPDADYFLAAAVLGLKIMGERSRRVKEATPLTRQGENGNGQRNGDIDPRAFGPRVPVAPHTATSTTDDRGRSSHKKVTHAMEELVADPDGGAGSLAKLLAARDEGKRNSLPQSRRAVAA